MAYTGSTTVLNLFLNTVFGVSSIPSLQTFQILQIKQELQGINEKVKLLNSGKCKAALHFFNRGEYEEAKKASIEGLVFAADIDTKVTATRTKILSEIILILKEESSDSVYRAGNVIRMCLDELLDDSMIKECWNMVRKYEKIKIVLIKMNMKFLEDLALVSSLLGGFYPALSNCLGWTNRLSDWDSEPVALLYTRYLPEGEQNPASLFIGTVGGQDVRMDVYKTAGNELKCKPVSGNCFQDKISYKVKARPDKPEVLRIIKKVSKIEFELQIVSKEEEMEIEVNTTLKREKVLAKLEETEEKSSSPGDQVDSHKNNIVNKWSEKVITDVTSNLSIDSIPVYIEIMKDLLHMEDSSQFKQFSQVVTELAAKCNRQKLNKSVCFENSKTTVGNTSMFAYFHCTKESTGLLSMSFAVHVMLFEMESGDLDTVIKDKEMYQRKTAFSHLKSLGIKVF